MQESSCKEILLWLLRRRQRYRVSGASMRPLLTADDEILVDLHAYRHHPPRIDDIVIARHPTQTGLQIIKRVKEVHEHETYYLQGDNPDGTENSPSLVPFPLILGRVTSRFAPAERSVYPE